MYPLSRIGFEVEEVLEFCGKEIEREKKKKLGEGGPNIERFGEMRRHWKNFNPKLMSINIYKEIIWSLFQFKIVRTVSEHAFLNFKENNVHQVYKVDVTNKPETYITWLHTGTL